MATWMELKQGILGNPDFTVKDADKNAILLEFKFRNRRTQGVLIQRNETQDGEEWVEISSPVGDISYDDLDNVLELAGRVICGGIVKSGIYYTLRHSMLIDDLSYEEFMRPLEIITKTADDIENLITGQDSY